MGIEGREISARKYLTKLSHERAFRPFCLLDHPCCSSIGNSFALDASEIASLFDVKRETENQVWGDIQFAVKFCASNQTFEKLFLLTRI